MSETHNFTFINKLTNEFYKFVGEIYIEYNKKKNESEKTDLQVENIEQKLNETILTETTSKPITQTFIEYLLFKLYYNYGVKRRMVSDHIALLYYSKNIKGYKPNEPITMICRHMLLDTRNMRIISLGIPKAVNLDEFCKAYDINKDNSETNFIKDNVKDNVKDNDNDETTTLDSTVSCISKSRIYKFSEGTMLIYNPSLKKHSITTISTKDDEDDVEMDENTTTTNGKNHLDKSTQDLIANNIEVKFNQQFMYSTRKVIGTGCFNSTKTFFEMFEENNKIANTNLENIPEDIINDKALVFNIEHPDNLIISTKVRNFNTLCAVFQFKNEKSVEEQFNKIMETTYSLDNEDIIRNLFKELGNDMITQIQVASFKKQIQEYNINLHLPEIIKSFEKLEDDGITKTTININELSFNQINDIVQNKPKDFQGYIVYGLNGERSKLVNLKYKELRNLKGNKPIVIEQQNTKNLFYLYWRLVKEQKIEQFIREFDINVELREKQFMYTKLFNWFLSLVRLYSINLFKIYHNAFVKKTFQKSDIPYSMKPMCGDLHTEYLKNKVPNSPTMVEQYIFNQPVSKIFWRLFLDAK